MKSLSRSRIPRVVSVTAFLLVLSLNATEEVIPSISETRPVPPTPEEALVLDELAEWVRGEYSDRFKALDRSDLAAVVRQRQQSFELFHSYSNAVARRQRLRDLPYGRMIERIAERHDIDGLLIASIIEAESGFNAGAISPVGAQGLMQLMPTTPGYPEVDAHDPWTNIDLGSRYLSRLLRQFDGDLVLALAAYNAGPGAVSRFQDVPPFRETRRYVRRVLSLYVDHHQILWEATGAGDFLFEIEAAQVAG